jgi:hypothetical protein
MNLPGPMSGTGPLAAWLNQLRAYTASLYPKQGMDWAISREPNGWVPRIQTGTSGSGIAEYKIKQVLGNYLSCVSWDGTTEGTTFVNIAKQFLLRESLPTPRTEGGIAYAFTYQAGIDASNRYRKKTRVADSSIETQLVAPPWVIDDVVYAMPASTSVLDSDGNEVKWLMLADSRQWTAVGTTS